MNIIQHIVRTAGGQRKVAALVGVTQQQVSRWVRQGYVPAVHVPRVAELSGVPGIALLSPKIVRAIQAFQPPGEAEPNGRALFYERKRAEETAACNEE